MCYIDWFKRRFLLYLVFFILIISIDQITKRIVLLDIGLNNTSSLIAGFVQFTVVRNTGGAFSIFAQYPCLFKIIGIVNMIIFSYLTFCPSVTFNNIIKIGCAFVLGGTGGNLIDRFLQDGVIDFIDLQIFNFAIFNLADVFINAGIVLVLVGWYLSKKKQCAQINK